MESAWDDTVLVEAFDAAIAKYQMREVLSKRKSSGHESYEDVGNQQDGLSGSSLQDWKESASVGQKKEDTMFVAEEAVETNHQLQKGAEGQTYYFGSKHERLPPATEESWQKQQLQNLEDEQEELFKQLYHVATYMFRSGAGVHQFWG